MKNYLTLYDNIEQFELDENSVNYCHIIDNAELKIAPERRLVIELYEPYLSDNVVTLFHEGKEDLFSEIEVDGKNVEPITYIAYNPTIRIIIPCYVRKLYS